MERRPRKPEQPILNRADTRWFVVAGLVMAVATLAVIAGAEHDRGRRSSRARWALTTFAIANLFFSFTARDELRSVFSLDTFNDRTFLAHVADVGGGDHLRDRAASSSSGSSTPWS